MANIQFPTVTVKMDTRRLHVSTLYYVVIESLVGRYCEEIACLMFSSPQNQQRIIQTAELLPLRAGRSNCQYGVSAVPMLLDKC